MGEARIYAAHRYSLLLNVLVVIVGALLVRGLLSYVVFALLGLSSLVLFFFAYLGEEKSYVATSLLGLIQTLYSVFAMLGWAGLLSTPSMAYGVVLVVLGLGAELRFRRGRSEGKKALSDFVPPAFG